MVYTIPTYDLGAALGQGVAGGLQQLGQREQQVAEAERLRQALRQLSPKQLQDPSTILQATAERPDIGIALSKAYAEKEKGETERLKSQIELQKELSKSTETKRSPEDIERAKLRVRSIEKKKEKAEESIPELQDQLSNLNYLENLAKDLRGPTGYFKGKIGIGGAAEFDSLSFAAIKPVLKSFNPVGPIPKEKIKIIEERFAPRSTDLYSKQLGKISSLKRITNQAMKNHQNYLDLLDAYDGDPPQSESRNLYTSVNSILDKIINEETKSLEEFEEKSKKKKPKKIAKGKSTTKKIVDKYLDLADNDPEKARELARADGYEF